MSNVKKFKRKERKYALSFLEYQQLMKKVSGNIELDKYGLHRITSLYFDTEDFKFMQDTFWRPSYQEKFRIRAYGENDRTEAFLEIKRKFEGITDKRRIKIPMNNLRKYIDYIDTEEIYFENVEDKHIYSEIQWMFRRLSISPKALITYDRKAFSSLNDSEFRVTFDFDICYSLDSLNIFDDISGYKEHIAPELDILMEVKTMGDLPYWLSNTLNELNINEIKFSKYKQVYQRYIKSGDK